MNFDFCAKLNKINKNHLIIGIIIVLVFLFYGNTLFNGFVLDDLGQIKNNVYLRSLTNIPKVVTGCTWEYVNRGCLGRTFYYRPVTYLSYFLTYQISSQPWAFHLINLVYFLVAVFLVFLLVKTISKDFTLAFVTALIFLLLPIVNEVINWPSATAEILFTIFVLLAVIFHLKYRDSGSARNLILVYIFFFLGLLSKETAIVLPLVLITADLLFFEITIKEIFSWKEFKKYLFFLVPFIIYYLMRSSVIGNGNYLGVFPLRVRLYAFFTLLAGYLTKLIYPYPLKAFYDFELSDNLFSSKFVFSFLIVLGLLTTFFVSLKRKKRFLAFSVVWFFCFLIPAIIFLQAVGAGMSPFLERYLFASSVGFAFFLAYFLLSILKIGEVLKKKSYLAKVLLFLFVFLILILYFFNYKRNQNWKDEETLFKVTLSQVPKASILRYQLANIYLKRGDLEPARLELERIIAENPEWKDITMAYKSLGDYYRAKNDLDNAIASYQKAVETTTLSARDFIVFNDLGVAYMDKGDYLKGAVYFCQSLGLLPNAETVNNNFNAALSMVESAYIQKGILYQKIAEELKESSEWRIQHLGKSCSEKTCAYSFSFVQGEQDILLAPFITAVISGSEKEIEIKGSNFNQEQGIFEVQIEESYSKKEIDFIFPSCRGIYYRVTILPR